MSNKVYTIGLVIFSGVCAIILAVWGMFSLRDNLKTNTLQSAVKTSLYAARDDSARVGRGTFIINKDEFKKDLAKTKLKEAGNKTVDESSFNIQYLPDKESKIDKVTGNFEAIKAVRVKADLKTGGVKSKRANADTHVATYVIQTDSKTSSNDKTNDLTR